jgi:hypothetical protein
MNSKLKLLKLTVLGIPALLLLGGCAGWSSDGVQVQPLPTNVSEPCDHPLDVISTVRGTSVGSDEIRMGRLGDALIECGQEKDIAVQGYEALTEILK